MKTRERILLRLALGDGVTALSARDLEDLGMASLDPRNAALVRLGALLALDPSASSLQRATQEAELCGLSPDEIVRCFVSIAPTLGAGHVSSVVPRLALAIGYDVDDALERVT